MFATTVSSFCFAIQYQLFNSPFGWTKDCFKKLCVWFLRYLFLADYFLWALRRTLWVSTLYNRVKCCVCSYSCTLYKMNQSWCILESSASTAFNNHGSCLHCRVYTKISFRIHALVSQSARKICICKQVCQEYSS